MQCVSSYNRRGCNHSAVFVFNGDTLKIAPGVCLESVCGSLWFRCLLGSAHGPRALITPSPLKPPSHRNPRHGAVWLAAMPSAVLSQALIANYCLDRLSCRTAGWTGDILLLFSCHFQCWRSFETHLWSLLQIESWYGRVKMLFWKKR